MSRDARFIIMKSGSSPPEYFRTKQLKKIGRRGVAINDVTIHKNVGTWSGSMRMARRYLHNTRMLPAGCEFIKVDAGSTKNGRARARKREQAVPF